MELVALGVVFAAGLVVGWFFLPVPAWVQKIYDGMKGE